MSVDVEEVEAPSLSAPLSPEVLWYLESRGIAVPDCPPLIRTPEPADVEGAVFSPEAVDKVLATFHALRHTQGKWAGKPLDPDAWQVAYVLAVVFGWLAPDESGRYVRIIRNLYVEVPRKNGKSTMVGGILVYLACADGEQGAQVVTAATTEKQAGFVFAPIKTLAEKSPLLSKATRPMQKRVLHPKTNSYIEVVTGAADAQHGGNIHGAGIDELHLHKNGDMVEALETGTGSRDQPLVVIITTADAGKPFTVYARKRRYMEQLAAGVLHDPTTYGVVWAALPSDDPFAESTWRKANPGLGTSPTLAYIRDAAARARQSPADLASFLRLHLNIRTRQQVKFLQSSRFAEGGAPLDWEAQRGREAYGGLDLASTSDLCALCWLLPDDATGGYDTLWRLWTPEENLDALDKRTAGAASSWADAGHLILTPGNIVDYAYIKADLIRDLDHLSAHSIGYDPWNASQLVTDLTNAGATMAQVRQGFGSLSAPLKEVERVSRARLLRGTNNPAVVWMVDNLTVSTDPAGNVKPDKQNSADKIDAVSAIVTAMSEAMRRTPPRRSAYERDDDEDEDGAEVRPGLMVV